MITGRHIRLIAAACAMAPLLARAEPPNGHPQNLIAHPPHTSPASPLPERGPAGLGRAYSGTPVDVLTYHYDSARTGWNQAETDLTQASVASKQFGLLATLKVDGNVLAQPLLVSGFVMPDGSTHDVLLVATGMTASMRSMRRVSRSCGRSAWASRNRAGMSAAVT